MILETIIKENDIKSISANEYDALAEEIRLFLINNISETGGHLGPNLGVVELTMALHLSLDLPMDKIVWDVGHQSYTHKLLTGRRDSFDTLRKYGGISGFPKRKESPCDCFDTGHSSTSISAGLGIVKARDIKGGNETIVSVIGDGAMTGGMAFEALNNAARLETNYIIILNDNEMSISENVGGMSKYLSKIRTADSYNSIKDSIYYSLLGTKFGDPIVEAVRRAKSGFKQLFISGMLFEDMGIKYIGPINGHDIKAITSAMEDAKKYKRTVLIHVVTKKGKGYMPAERHPARFHGTAPFDKASGIPKNKKPKADYTDVFSTVMVKLGERNDNIVAITAAMPTGTGLTRFSNKYPDRFFDVGIAEQHAVTFAAGLAMGGLHPVIAIYSSFLQRAYDQILHDVCIQNLPVVFAIDRAGLVGSDGETHQGIFDISYLSTIPNMTIMAPKNKWELSDMMKYAISMNSPVAIRYPRGEAYDGLEECRNKIEHGKSEILYDEGDVVIFSIGKMVEIGVEVRNMIKDMGYGCSLVNARFAKPVDEDVIENMYCKHRILVTLEDNVLIGGYGERVRSVINISNSDDINRHILCFGVNDAYVEHGNVDRLYQEVGLSADQIFDSIKTIL